MSSLSQEESRSISENVKWGQRKRFADGKTSVAFSRFLGYDQDEDGNWVINEEKRYRKAEAACSKADERIRKQGARNRLLGQMIRKSVK